MHLRAEEGEEGRLWDRISEEINWKRWCGKELSIAILRRGGRDEDTDEAEEEMRGGAVVVAGEGRKGRAGSSDMWKEETEERWGWESDEQKWELHDLAPWDEKVFRDWVIGREQGVHTSEWRDKEMVRGVRRHRVMSIKIASLDKIWILCFCLLTEEEEAESAGAMKRWRTWYWIRSWRESKPIDEVCWAVRICASWRAVRINSIFGKEDLSERTWLKWREAR
jgi:hypothetical protein